MLLFISFDFHLLYFMLLQREIENSLREFWSNWHDKNFIFGQTQYSHTATHSNTHCNTLQHTLQLKLQHNATPHQDMCLQHSATHCNTLQHTATHCSILQHTATHCNKIYEGSTSHVSCIAYDMTRCVCLCNTLQHTATHRNTLQHIAIKDKKKAHHTSHKLPTNH